MAKKKGTQHSAMEEKTERVNRFKQVEESPEKSVRVGSAGIQCW